MEARDLLTCQDKIYTITPAGEECLNNWQQTLQAYTYTLNELLVQLKDEKIVNIKHPDSSGCFIYAILLVVQALFLVTCYRPVFSNVHFYNKGKKESHQLTNQQEKRTKCQ